MNTGSDPGWLARLGALLRLRCPRCREGRLFRSLLEMNDPCPRCGLVFQREEGYFLGALYVSYGLGCVIISLCFGAAWWLFPDAPTYLLCGAILAGYLPFMPVIYRYARAIWLHLDRFVNPGDLDAGSYEKVRLRQSRSAASAPGTQADRTPPD